LLNFPYISFYFPNNCKISGAFSREEAETLVAKAETQGFELQTSRGPAYGASDDHFWASKSDF
jgi:hypothetical protein